MLLASILAHASFGMLLGIVFTLYYINGDGKWKVLIESIIGIGGNAGIIFALDNLFAIENTTVRLYDKVQ